MRRPARYYAARNLGTVPVAFDPITAAVGGAAAIANLWVASARLRGGQKIASSEVANRVEAQLKQNLSNYQGQASQHTTSQQAQALAVFDYWIDFLQSPDGCGNQGNGSAGERCISERVRGGQWDWYALYRDPIANDSNVIADANPVAATVDSITQSITQATGLSAETIQKIAIGAAILLAVVFLMGDD
jgi:hypothetical protein